MLKMPENKGRLILLVMAVPFAKRFGKNIHRGIEKISGYVPD